MIFELIGGLLEWGAEVIGDLLGESAGELIGAGAEMAAELGTAVVAVGVGAAALGAIVALAELSLEAIKKWLYSAKVASRIEDILNKNPQTLAALGHKLQNAPKFSLSQMKKVVHEVKRTQDGQTVATIRVTHPLSGVYTDVRVAGNTNKNVYEGAILS